jgi:hypothetical protein
LDDLRDAADQPGDPAGRAGGAGGAADLWGLGAAGGGVGRFAWVSIWENPKPGFAETQAPFATEARALGPEAIAQKAVRDAIKAEKERRWLEELVHPLVGQRFAAELERLADAPVVVLMPA